MVCLWVPVPVFIHALSLYLSMWMCPSVYVCVCIQFTQVNPFGAFTVLASWLPLTCDPLSQSAYPCLLHCADSGYCPARSTLKSSISPQISILITTQVNTAVPCKCKTRNKMRICHKRSYSCWQEEKNKFPSQWEQKTEDFYQNGMITNVFFFSFNKRCTVCTLLSALLSVLWLILMEDLCPS